MFRRLTAPFSDVDGLFPTHPRKGSSRSRKFFGEQPLESSRERLGWHARAINLKRPEIRGFEEGLAGRGWRQTNAQKEPKKIFRNVSPSLLLRGHRKKGTEKRLESLAYEGFPHANPFCPPTPFRNF